MHAARPLRPTDVAASDGSTTFVVSAWEGSAWKTVDDSGTLETRRWLDGDTLMMARRCLQRVGHAQP